MTTTPKEMDMEATAQKANAEAQNMAFDEFAKAVMPWVLDKPEDDAERLIRSTAKIAFGYGYQAGRKDAGAAA